MKPITFLGINGKEALNKILAEKDKQEKPAAKVESKLELVDYNPDYYFMPGINLYIGKERSLRGSKWNKAKKELHNHQSRMLTIAEFASFLAALKSGNQEMQSIYEDITAVRNPWRAEWLDASFSSKDNKLYVSYSRFNQAGSIEEVTEQLDPATLMQNKQISLEDWLGNPTKQGLPRKDIKQGSSYYWHPRAGTVAGFVAGAGGADLVCDGNPRGSGSALGVRHAKFKV